MRLLLLLLPLLLLLARPARAHEQPELYFAVSPADERAAEGQPARLRCLAEPRAEVRYAWRLDGRPLAPSPRRRMEPRAASGDLLISRLSRLLDGGEFVCEATHAASGRSIASSPAKLDVQWISEASVHLQQPKPPGPARAGTRVELRCQADGSGELRYEWLRNGRSVQPGPRVQARRNLLLIDEAGPGDSGLYRCLARNAAGASGRGRSLALAVASDDSAAVRAPPRSLVVRRGESARFGCAFERAERVEWYAEQEGDAGGRPIGREPADADGRYVVAAEQEAGLAADLVIASAQDRHRGFYSCHGIRPPAAPQVFSAELQIAYLKNLSEASFEPRLPDQLALVAEGEELQVSCLSPDGLPPPRLFWRDPQGRLVSDSGAVRVQDDTLIIARARAEQDQGNYSCIAENMAGSSSLSLRVLVTRAPELREPLPRSLSVAEDEPAALSCLFSATPAPWTLVSWLKDGEPLREPSRQRLLLEQPGNATLHLRAARPADRGSYVCEVATRGHPALRSPPALLSVRERLKFSPPPVSRRLELNSSAKVSCKAQGSSPPTVGWSKDGGAPLPRHVHVANGSLHFDGVLEADRGNYTCVAENEQGRISHSIRIDVVIAPKFAVRPENVTALEGEPAMLQCAAEGEPKPAIHWDKDSRMNSLPSERFVKLANDSLYIREVYLSDEGKYGCTAGNSGGLKREELYLSVRASERGAADADAELAADGPMMTRTVLVTLGAAAAYMLLVVGLMLYCRCRRQRRKQRSLEEQADAAEEATAKPEQAAEAPERREEEASAPASRPVGGQPSGDGTDTAHSQHSHNSNRSRYEALAASRAHLQQLKPLGRGEFGEVFSGRYRAGGADGGDETLVMAKSLSRGRDEGALQEFQRQLELLRALSHENVARLVGLCRDEGPDCMLVEYTDWGDLKQFLLASRAPRLAAPQLLSLASQAAQALQHLSGRRLVHRDVAARNCLVSSGLRLKLTLACLSKEPYQQEYARHRNRVIPLRWMPREAVFEDEYSAKSDAYAWAVLVWELLQRAELPLRRLSDESVLAQLRARELAWSAPEAAPPALRRLLEQCWSDDPRERPTFDRLAEDMLLVAAAQ